MTPPRSPRGRAIGACVVAVLVGATLAGPAVAGPPREARIQEGRGMGGVRLQARGRSPDGNGVIRAGRFQGWGRVVNGWCFEQMCSWPVPGGGVVFAEFTGGWRVATLMTTARRWRTGRGIGPGAPVARMRRRYRGERRIVECEIGPNGSPLSGWAVRRARRGWTVFETRGQSQRLHAVRIMREGTVSSCW